MVLDTNNHAVFSLSYHLVLVVYDKNDVVVDDISERLKSIFEKISQNFNIILKGWCNYGYYLHITFKAYPNSALSRFINSYKSTSSNLIKKDYSELKNSLYKNKFWASGYLLYSSGNFSDEIINNYLNQKKYSRGSNQ